MLNNKEKDNFIHHITSKFIIGENLSYKIKGSKEQLSVLKEMMDISKELYQKIHDDNSNLNEIVYLAEVKSSKAQRFKKEFGFDWRL